MNRLYAIVDIETTGGHASSNGITEIAIIVCDGNNIIEEYQTLINPEKEIPVFIESLTGISNKMVAEAPLFKEVAAKIYAILNNKIFIAHNVNFDYSFVNYHLIKEGYHLNCKKLCSVRLARKIFPGLPSYSLGKICRHFNINNISRHRAMGDALATTNLFFLMLENDRENKIEESLKSNSKEQILPPNLSREELLALPKTPGVYYFKDKSGKILYVGKAINLYKRVCSHFSNNNPGKKKQDFLRQIYSIHYQSCGTELMAIILETIEIKRLWPAQNKALKNAEAKFGLYVYEDQVGYLRLGVGKKAKFSKPFHSFCNLNDAYFILRKIVDKFNLCPKLSFLQNNVSVCTGREEDKCLGACELKEAHFSYNLRVNEALKSLQEDFATFVIVDRGRTEIEKSCILVEKGNFYGLGYFNTIPNNIKDIKEKITPYPSYGIIQNMILDFSLKNPDKTIYFS